MYGLPRQFGVGQNYQPMLECGRLQKAGASASGLRQEFLSMNVFFVEKRKCAIDSARSTYFRGLYYSYAMCNDLDRFTTSNFGS
jgi:hypothetical protein